MPAEHPVPVVRQLRLVVEAADYDAAVAFFRDRSACRRRRRTPARETPG
ncbi:hypothetical protein [Micromonospora sp. NPDC050695]